MTGHPLPEFLEDLDFTLNGKPLRMFAGGRRHTLKYLAFEEDAYSTTGVFFDTELEIAESRCGQALTIYESGQTTTYTAWDEGDQPTPSAAPPFLEWVRRAVASDIERLLSWHLESMMKELPLAEHPARYLQLCEECAGIPVVAYDGFRDRSALFQMLGAVYRIIERDAVAEADETVFEHFLERRDQATYRYDQELHQSGQDIALTLLPVLPRALEAALTKELDTLFAPFETPLGELSSEQFMTLARQYARLPEVSRKASQPRLMALCVLPSQAHIAFSALLSYPAEADRFLKHGLALDSESISLLVAAETFLLEHTDGPLLKDVKRRIKALGGPQTSANDVQAWIDRYTYLCNDFRYFTPQSDPAQTGPELVALEARLNQHWLSFLPSLNAPSCPPIENELKAQNRFLSAGSAAYVGWLRVQGRHDEVVEYMMQLGDDPRLHRLRYDTSPITFESYLNNGLGSFLDSKKAAHIAQAIELMDALEAIIPEWEDGQALYNLGCVAARAGQLERAMKYVRPLLADGRSILDITADEDFENLWTYPDFIALQEAHSA